MEKCPYCDKLCDNKLELQHCRESHNVIFVPLMLEDLKRLIQFIYLKQDNLLTPSLINTLLRYNTIKPTKSQEEKE